MFGRVAQLIIREETGVRPFPDVTIQLSSKKSNPTVTIKTSSTDEVLCKFRLQECTYLPDSSQPGSVECIRNGKTKQSLVIIDQAKTCTPLLDHIRKCLTEPAAANESDEDEQDESIEKLTTAIVNSDLDTAAKLAGTLANSQKSVNFVLDMINDSDDAVKIPKPPAPIAKTIKLNLSIESYKIADVDNEQHELAVLPNTTIRELKQMVQDRAEIDIGLQYWFHRQDLLNDDYKFGVDAPHLNDGASVILYIVKPQ